jgi:regulatory protein
MCTDNGGSIMDTVEISSSKRRASWVTLKLDNGESVKVHDEVVMKYSLFPGFACSEERWHEIIAVADEHACYFRLLSLLSQRPHTEAELARKLMQRKFRSPTISKALKKAAQLGLLDDGHFAVLFAEEKRAAGNSRRLITAQLRKRGVDQAHIEAAFEDLDDSEDTEWSNALATGEKKWRSLRREPDAQKRKHRLISFLARRGFDTSVCFRVYEEVSGNSDDVFES